MVKVAGRQTEIGLGIESTSGTAVTPTIYPQWTDFSVQAVSEKTLFQSARGQRHSLSDSKIRRKFAEGSIGVVPNVEVAPYFFGLALGSVSTAAASGETAVWEHTITTQDDNASMKTATAIVKQGSVVEEQYTNVVANSLNLEVTDDFASMTLEIRGKFPSTGVSLSPSYTQETQFAYSDLDVKFGTDISNADGQTATKLRGFTLNISNEVLMDEAFLSGSSEPADGGFVAGPQTVTGSYTLQFEDTTELDKYKDHTKNACIASFTGASIGSGETEEIRIELGKLVLTSPPKEYNIDGLVMLTQEFEVEHDASDGNIKVIVTNEDDGSNY